MMAVGSSFLVTIVSALYNPITILLIAYYSRGPLPGYCLDRGSVVGEVSVISLTSAFKWYI